MKPPAKDLYDVARHVCHSFGLPWTDPRTGETHQPPAAAAPQSSSYTELRYNVDGSLDEVIGKDCMAHLEQMSATHWWLSLATPDGRDVHISFYSTATIRAVPSDE